MNHRHPIIWTLTLTLLIVLLALPVLARNGSDNGPRGAQAIVHAPPQAVEITLADGTTVNGHFQSHIVVGKGETGHGTLKLVYEDPTDPDAIIVLFIIISQASLSDEDGVLAFSGLSREREVVLGTATPSTEIEECLIYDLTGPGVSQNATFEAQAFVRQPGKDGR